MVRLVRMVELVGIDGQISRDGRISRVDGKISRDQW